MGISDSDKELLLDDPLLTVGAPADDCCPPHSRIWFSKWFTQTAGITFFAPAAIWRRDGNKITRTYRDDYVRPSGGPNPPPMVWFLTGEVDSHGWMLGVWPD